MIPFKQFITEARLAPLYHGTNASKLESLIKDGFRPFTLQVAEKLMLSKNKNTKSRDGTDIVGYYNGVSLTRSKQFAIQWSKEHEISIVLELDQQKLAQKYKIKPMQFWKGKTRSDEELTGSKNVYNEYEEFVVTDKPIPFKYVTKVWYKPTFKDPKTQSFADRHNASVKKGMYVFDNIRHRFPDIKFEEIK